MNRSFTNTALRATFALASLVSIATISPAQTAAPQAKDPRVGLKAGLQDAGEAAFGLVHLTSLGKPAGFAPPPPAAGASARSILMAQLAFANSDFAFSGTHLFQGNFYGVNFYDISHPEKITLTTSLVCPGGQGDVSVSGHLLFMSVEMPNGRLDCGAQGFPAPPEPPPAPAPVAGAPAEAHPARPLPAASPDRFRGVRIFDISDLKNPKQVAAIQTCRGSHTHTLVNDPKDKDNLYIYVSGTSFVRQKEELAGCSGDAPDKDPNTSLFSIDVIKVPIAHPEEAKIVASPRVFIDPRSGAVNGIFNGGSHDKGEEKSTASNQCHDITVYSAIGLAAGACSGNGILLDISNPAAPKRIDAVNDPNYAYWHSASFSNDGTKVVFTDEWGGGVQPRCRSTDPLNYGADAIFNLKDGKLTPASYYKMPAAQTEQENCVAHNGSLIPIPGRDIEVQAWYQGGISVMDFTDAAHPFEIAYFDRGPIDATKAVLGGQWSAYWYNGYIYGSEIARGIDVLKLTPSKYLSQNEIDAANLVHFDELNVQNQQKMTWPQNTTVAHAYLDQLSRSNALNSGEVSKLNAALAKAVKSHSKTDSEKLNAMGSKLESEAASARTPADATHLHALASILQQSGL